MKVDFKTLLKPFNIIKACILIVLCIIVFSLYQNTYDHQVNNLRTEKDHSFRTSIQSPIADKYNFKGLNYFHPDEKFKVSANLIVVEGAPLKEIELSDGHKRKYSSFAKASFMLDTISYELTLFKIIDEDKPSTILFLPFTDKTSGETTYASGRYLDVEYSGGQKATLDFNLAYHPYCVYNYKFSCPIPPAENYLDAYILAGEKLESGPQP